MPHMAEIPSPFQHLTKDQFTRTTVNIPNHIICEIKRLESKTGVIQNTVDVLLNKFYEQLTNTKLETSDRQSYHLAINGCSVVLGGGDNNKKRGSVAKSKTRRVAAITLETPH
jgi:hypothetical protein